MKYNSVTFDKMYEQFWQTDKPLGLIMPFGDGILPKIDKVKEFFPTLQKAAKVEELTFQGFTKDRNQKFHQIFIKCLYKNRKGKTHLNFDEFVEGFTNVASHVLLEFHIFYENFQDFTVDYEYFEMLLQGSEELSYLNLILH